MSYCTTAMSAMKKAVIPPITSTNDSAVCDSSNKGDILATMNIPAVTMVAAWISAEIGVGPSIESGSQTCNGTWADFPMAPMNKQIQMAVINGQPVPCTCSVANSSALANTSA